MGIKVKLFSVILLFFTLAFIPAWAVNDDAIVRVGITDNKFQNVLKQQLTVFGTADCDICDKTTRKTIYHVRPNTDITVTNMLS